MTRNEACDDVASPGRCRPASGWTTPTWSQDGTRVAVRAMQYDPAGVASGPGHLGRRHRRELRARPVQRAPRRPVPDGPGPGPTRRAEPLYRSLTATPRWSIDGRTVVYGRPPADGSSGSELYLADVGAARVCGRRGRGPDPGRRASASSPVFSPVDDRIAFVLANRTSACRLNDLRAHDANRLRSRRWSSAARSRPAPSAGFDWSPDGASIAFNATTRPRARDDIWTIRVGASKATVVLSTPGAFYWVTGWR